MNATSSPRKGFTLIELLVVASIIAILAALLLPLINIASLRANQARCANAARTIAVSVQTYSAGWAGWTNPDSSSYVKDFGYKLSTEKGYFGEPVNWYDPATTPMNESEQYALKVKDFRCPLDKGPKPNRHGYPSSYIVSSAYAGKHIGSIETEPADTVIVIEDQKRHPTKDDNVEKHYVFGDFHVDLGWKRSHLAGLRARWWNTCTSGWSAVKADNYTVPPDYEQVWSGPLSERNFGFLPPTGKAGNWGRGIGAIVDNILMRLDGFIEFPQAGTWLILSLADDWSLCWVDINENDKMDGGEVGEYNGCCQPVFLRLYNGVQTNKRYKCAFMFTECGGGNYFDFFMTQDLALQTIPGGTNKVVIPGTALSHIP